MTIHRIIFSLILVTGLITPLLAQDELFGFVGSYEGSVASGSDFIDVVTLFMPQKSGKVLGTYTMYEDDQPEIGTLDFIKEEGPGILLLKWTDKYGSGLLRIIFASDRSSFVGYWGQNSSNLNYPWTGRKIQNDDTIQEDQNSNEDPF